MILAGFHVDEIKVKQTEAPLNYTAESKPNPESHSVCGRDSESNHHGHVVTGTGNTTVSHEIINSIEFLVNLVRSEVFVVI